MNDIVKKSIMVKISVVIRICVVLILLFSFFSCGVEINVDMFGMVVIILLRNVILLLFGFIDFINSVRIGFIELL